MTCKAWIIIALTAFTWLRTETLTCLDRERPLDWYIEYKLQRNPSSRQRLVQQGVAILEQTSVDPQFQFINTAITAGAGHGLIDTLRQFYEPRDARNPPLAVFWNDQPPGWLKGQNCQCNGGPSEAKGFILGDANGVALVVHTVPGFPLLTHYDFPAAERENADLFMCLSISYQSLNDVASAFLYGSVFFYHQEVPTLLRNRLGQSTQRFLRREQITTTPYRRHSSIFTVGAEGGETGVQVFGKLGKASQDIYHEFIGTHYSFDMSVWSIYNSRNQLQEGVCHPPQRTFAVLNSTLMVQFRPEPVRVRRRTDRSNLGYVLDGDQVTTICVSDMSRTTSAIDKSGTAVCLDHQMAARQHDFVGLSPNNQCRGNG